MTTDDVEHRPITRALARELKEEADSDHESSDDEQETMESGALRTPQTDRVRPREVPGAPKRRRNKQPRYVAFDDPLHEPGEEPHARRQLFQPKEAAQGSVVLLALIILVTALLLSFFDPLAHVKAPYEFAGGMSASRAAATLLVAVALGMVASAGRPIDAQSESN